MGCDLGTHTCDQLATCVDTEGSFECNCMSGYNNIDNQCVDIDECAVSLFNDCDTASGASCTNTDGSFICSCPNGMGGAGTNADPCTAILGTCSNFESTGYSATQDCSNMAENELCTASCAENYYATGDGQSIDFSFRCVCTGDRTSAASLTCNFELETSSPVQNAQCITCDIEQSTTWFGQATNNVRVSGPNGGLVNSRVQSNTLIQSDWSEYTVMLMMPGDWSQARIFSWIFDVDLTILESDGTSTLVVLRQNANSPVLEVNTWSQFYVGFDNVAQYVADNTWDTYRIGIVPGSPTSEQLTCLVDILPVIPTESPERVERRKIRQEKIKEMWGDNHQEDRPRWNQKYQIKNQRQRSLWSDTVDLIAKVLN